VPVRRLGSAALDLLLGGLRQVLMVFYEHKLQAWDSAAGYLIVEEAGGKSYRYERHALQPLPAGHYSHQR